MGSKADGAAVRQYVPPKKVTKAVAELRELEAEKKQIEAALRRLKTQKVQKMINDTGTGSDSDDYSDEEYSSSEGSASSDVSSLHSRAASEQVSELEKLSDGDESVMTENFYHYDVRGRRQSDDNLYNFDESGTALACYQQAGNGNNNTPVAKRPKTSSKEAPVVIEWSRGRTYVPAANLATDEVYYNHPTEVSLMVVDDKSFFDDLSFSSGDDSKLAAAVTDMPMEIDFDLSKIKGDDNDGDDISFASGLHSDGCSISIMAPPPTTAAETPSSSKIKPPTRDKSGEQAFNTAAPYHNDNRNLKPLYVRDESSEENSRQTDGVQTTNAVSPSSNNNQQEQQNNSKKGSGKGGILNMELSPRGRETETDISVLSSDISAKPAPQANNNSQQHGRKLPQKISFSDLSVESLGSEMCGVSVQQQQQQQQQGDQPEGIPSTRAQHTRTIPTTTPSPKGTGSDKPAKSNKSNTKKKQKAQTDSDSEEIIMDVDELSAEDMAVIQKRQEEMLQLDSGDERPLQNISKRKKRRSIDATTGQIKMVGSPRNATASRKKRTQTKRPKNPGNLKSSSSTKQQTSNTKEESRNKKKSDSNK